jgi:hypothetical protein
MGGTKTSSNQGFSINFQFPTFFLSKVEKNEWLSFCFRQKLDFGQNHPKGKLYQQYFLGKHYLPHPHSPSLDISPPEA